MNVLDSILCNWNINTSVQVCHHNFIQTVHKELKEGMLQKRYRRDEGRLTNFINTKEMLFPEENGHFLTGFIIWNIKHPMTRKIQTKWKSYIEESGIFCQVSFNFIAREFKDFIDVMPLKLWTNRY
jgi:hypothetical protein